MKTKILHILGLILLLAGCAAPTAAPVVQPTQVALLVSVPLVTVCGTPVALHASVISECWQATSTPTPTNTATATSTSTATATATRTPLPSATATLTNVVQLFPWHPPGAHLDPITHLPLPVHEHGDQPPPQVMAAVALGQCPAPFSQTREGHVYYKGMLAFDQGTGLVESYMVVHVASTTAATAHGNHDGQAYFITLVTGVVSCFNVLFDFGSPPPLITATVDPGIRPIILSKNDGRGTYPDCETWYSAPGKLVFDLGWTICNRWDRLDGTRVGGNGTHRGADWHVYIDRFSEWPGMDPNLAKYAVDDHFGHLRLDFVRNDVQFPDSGVTGPN